MSSKPINQLVLNYVTQLVCGIIVVSSLGCGIKLGEKNNQDEVVIINSADCLRNSLPKFRKYFQGKSTDLEAASAFECLQDVFVAFRENIRGEAKDSYTPQEIAMFVEQNFLSNESHFTNSFLNEVMYLKVALFGGNTVVVNKAEVDDLVVFLKKMTPELVNLNKHMPIITFNWTQSLLLQNDPEKEEKFNQAKKALQQFTTKISAELEAPNRAYDIEHLANLITEVALFINSDPKVIKKIQDAKPFIKRFKLLLIGGDNSLQGKEWNRLFSTLHEFLFQALRYEYFLKELTSQDLETRWENYQKITLDLSKLLEALLQNKETRALTNAEIHQLFKELTPIFDEANLDLDLLNRLGELKVSLLGDSPMSNQGWSTSDLQQLQLKVPSLFSSLGRLHQLYTILNSKGLKSNAIDPNEFQKIEKEFLEEFKKLGQFFVKPYSLSSLKSLITGLVDGPLKNIVNLPKNFDQMFEVAVSAKETLTGSKGNSLSLNDLRLMLDLGAGFYLHYVEYTLFVKPFNFINLNFVPAFSEVWYKAIKNIDDLLSRRQNKTIKSNEIIPLILKLQQTGLLNTEFSSSSLKTVLDAFWSNLLNDPQVRLSGNSQQGLNKVALARLRSEIEIFLQTQKQIISVYKHAKFWNRKKLVETFVARMAQTSNRSEQIGLSEMIYLNGKSVALNFDDQNKFLLISTSDSDNYSYYDITVSNISRAISRLLITSYANDIERVHKKIGVTLPELQTAFDQFKSIAIESGALDPENTTFINNRFLEGNLFLSVSNGDQYANFDEVHNLLLHIYSGLNRAEVLKSSVKKQCGFLSTNRKNTNHTVDVSCLLKTIYNEQQAFIGLPGFLSLKNQYALEEVIDYTNNLLLAAGHPGGDIVKTSDMDLVPHVIQYVEMVFATYDRNQNGLLEKDEALKAFPIFHNLIKELTSEYNLKDQELPGVFIYLLKYGRGPKTIPEKLAFLNFIRNPDKWDIQTSRLGVGKIFRFIAESKKDKPFTGSNAKETSASREKKRAVEEEKRKRKEMEDLYKG